MLLRLAWALIFLSLSRILLIVMAPGSFKPIDISDILYLYFVGLRFDISALLYVNAAFILLSILPFTFWHHKSFRALVSLAFIIPNSIAMLANLADAAYFSFSLKRTTADILLTLNAGGDITRLIWDYVFDYWFIMITWLVLSGILIVINKKYNYGLSIPRTLSWKNFLRKTGVMAIILLCSIMGMRGGLQLRPISNISASLYTYSPIHAQVVLNTPFSIFTTINSRPLPDPTYFPDLASAAIHFEPVQPGSNAGAFQASNIVLVILESFSSEYSILLSPEQHEGCTGFTPFLDSLMNEGIWFNGYANGTRSIEAVAAILSGLPSLIQVDFISSQFAGNCLPSLASLLKEKAYTSVFYHGGHNGTMNFDAFAAKVGFDGYYGMNEYNNLKDYDGKWGIYDEPFLNYFLDGLSSLPSPFLGVAFTLSSHHPYSVPVSYQDVFTGGKHPIHKTIQYSDFALRKFFEQAKSKDWYQNTLFVITADHTSLGCETTSSDPLHRYRIPIVFFHPGQKLPDHQAHIVQQTDILPSILEILRYDKPFISFGQSIFAPDRLNYTMAGQQGVYHLLHMDTLVQFIEGEMGSSYQQGSGPSRDRLSADELRHTELLGKALIQQYIYRLNHNLLCQIE